MHKLPYSQARPPLRLQVKRRLIECPALVTGTSADGSCAVVLLAVLVPNSTWSGGAHRWRGGDRAALLFQHLLPPRAVAPPGSASQPIPQLSYVEQLRQDLAGQGVQVPERFRWVLGCGRHNRPTNPACNVPLMLLCKAAGAPGPRA